MIRATSRVLKISTSLILQQKNICSFSLVILYKILKLNKQKTSQNARFFICLLHDAIVR